MKNTIYISFVLLLLAACKPASGIVTSKEAAVKKGMYSAPKPASYAVVKPEKKKRNPERAILPKQDNTPSRFIKESFNNKNEDDILVENDGDSYLIKQLINSASDNLGVGYRGGGTTRNGFDCSGLIYSTFKKFDITLPRSSHEMATVGTKINLSNAKKGDLIFFINRGQHRINHVGMVIEVNNDEIKFIHSSTQSGVIISSTKESYYNRTFAQINRVI